MKKIVTVGLAAVALVLSLSACNIQDVCSTLTAPTAEQARVAAPENVEVEIEAGSVDCELITNPDGQSGTWQRESES